MKNFVLAIEPEHAAEIRARLKEEKKITGKNIRRIVTDILLRENVFICTKNRENGEKQSKL